MKQIDLAESLARCESGEWTAKKYLEVLGMLAERDLLDREFLVGQQYNIDS